MPQKELGKIRINGGRLRGRQVSFSAFGVRPTKATVRKTLFNWLRPAILNRDCLDCFCGSGILGIEALSEGARSVVALDCSQQVLQSVETNAIKLGLDALTVQSWRFPDKLSGKTFNLVFLDPPFDKIDTESVLQWLSQQLGCLRDGALIYVEQQKGVELNIAPAFEVIRHASSAGVSFYLLGYRKKRVEV